MIMVRHRSGIVSNSCEMTNILLSKCEVTHLTGHSTVIHYNIILDQKLKPYKLFI